MTMDTLWNATLAATSKDDGGDTDTDPSIPDGEYNAEVLNFRCWLSKKGEWWMKWVMAVRGGLLDGRALVRLAKVNAKSAPYLKADVFYCLGRDAAFGGELADIPTGGPGPVCREMVGAVVRAAKKSRLADNGQTYLDVYINDGVSLPSRPPADLQEPDPFRDAGEPPALPSQPSRDARFVDIPFPTDDDVPDGARDSMTGQTADGGFADDEIPF